MAGVWLIACSSEPKDLEPTGTPNDGTGGSSTGGSTVAGSSTGGNTTGGNTTGGNTTGGNTTGGNTTGGVGEPPVPSEVPVIDTLFATVDDTGTIVAVEFEGRAGIRQVSAIVLNLLDAEGQELDYVPGRSSWLLRPNRFLDEASAGHLEQTGDRFWGFMSHSSTALEERPQRVRVTIEDIEEVPGEPAEALLEAPSPVRLAEGAVCDPFELLNHCENAAICDIVDSKDWVAPTCQTPSEVCPLDLPELHGSVQASNQMSADITTASCTFSRGNLGNEQGHVFVASRDGEHRFRAESVGYQVTETLFVRRFCNYGRAEDSELACAHAVEFPAGDPVELVVELSAGQTVFVYVEASWVRGGEYLLSVEEPD